MSGAQTTSPAVAAAAAAASALLPLAGTKGQLASTMLSQGLAFWSDFSAKMAAGTLTVGDAEEAAAKLGTSMGKLAADIAAMPDDATGG